MNIEKTKVCACALYATYLKSEPFHNKHTFIDLTLIYFCGIDKLDTAAYAFECPFTKYFRNAQQKQSLLDQRSYFEEIISSRHLKETIVKCRNFLAAKQKA